MAGTVSSRSGRKLRSKAVARRTAAARRRMLLAAAGALAFVTVAPLSISSMMGWDATLPALAAAKSFLALMDDRSPGDRTAAELTKTKTLALAEKPHQRALAKVVNPPEFETALAPPPPEFVELPPFAAAITNLGPLLTVPPAPPPGGGIITTTDVPPGGGGGTPPPTDVTPPDQPENPPPAVPEPATWATMLLGFALTGSLLRRRRQTTAVPVRT